MLLAVGLAQPPHKAEPAVGFPTVQVGIGRVRMKQEQLHHSCLVQSPSEGQGQHPVAAFGMGESCFACCCSCTSSPVALSGCCLIFEGCLAWDEPSWECPHPCIRTGTTGPGDPARVAGPFHQVAGVAQLDSLCRAASSAAQRKPGGLKPKSDSSLPQLSPRAMTGKAALVHCDGAPCALGSLPPLPVCPGWPH